MDAGSAAAASGVASEKDKSSSGRGDLDRGDSRGSEKKQHHSNTDTSLMYGSSICTSELYMQKPKSPGFKVERNGKRYCNGEVSMILSLPKQDGKVLHKRSVKMLSTIPCPKRPKIEQGKAHDDSKLKEHEEIFQKNVPEVMQCTSSERVRLVKQRRSCDGKRVDKKINKCGVRGKSDFLAPKVGSFDSVFLGLNAPGTSGNKSDVRDITNNFEELSLSELLDGSYNYLSVSREKRKRALHLKNELLQSIGNACSILSLDAADSNRNRRDIIQNNLPNLDVASKTNDESVALSKDSFTSNQSLCHPRVVLERIGLSFGQNLDLPLTPCAAALPSSRHITDSEAYHSVSLPPFPWSNSMSGTYRPSVDSCKPTSSRNISQGQWIRLNSRSAPRSSQSSSNHANNVELLHEIECLKEAIGNPCEKPLHTFSAQINQDSILQYPETKKDYSKTDSGSFDRSEISGFSSLKHTWNTIDQTSNRLMSEISKEVLCAAEILCELAYSADLAISQGYCNGTMRMPKSPTQKAVKFRKPSSSSAVNWKFASGRSGFHHSAKYRPFLERKNGCNLSSSSSKGTIRWPVPVSGSSSSPSKSERGLLSNTRHSHGNEIRHTSHLSSQTQTVKDYENEQRLRKALIMQSSSGFAASCGGSSDWDRQQQRGRRI